MELYLSKSKNKDKMEKILLTGPKIGSVSGISTHLQNIINSKLSQKYKFIITNAGKNRANENAFQKTARIIVDYLNFIRLLAVTDLVHINTSFSEKALLRDVIALHVPILKPGGFLAINIADILCFPDPHMPRIQAANPRRHRSAVTREDVLAAKAKYPHYNRYQLAELLGCSEQTIDRRLNGNNIRGGKYATQTRVKLVGGIIEQAALDAGLYLYDRRVWLTSSPDFSPGRRSNPEVIPVDSDPHKVESALREASELI